MQRVHLIEVKYLSPTNSKGSSIKITSLRFKDSTIISYNYNFNNISEIFESWLKELNNDLGVVSVGYNEYNNTYIYGVSVYEPIKNIKKGGVLV